MRRTLFGLTCCTALIAALAGLIAAHAAPPSTVPTPRANADADTTADTAGLADGVVDRDADGIPDDIAEKPWDEILGPAEPSARPDPLPQVVWRDNVKKALAEAEDDNRPLFVTFRCLPCKQCADFDKDVLEGGPQIDPLLKQFVTVRLTTARDADLRLFPMAEFQDMDMSWWGYFLSPTGQIYAIFGGRDDVSDSTRISLPALQNTMRRVLDHHYDPRRGDWDIDGKAPRLRGSADTPTELRGFRSYAHLRPRTADPAECLHCHDVVEIMRQPDIERGKFDKEKDLDMWPLPENVGITVDRDDGLLVTAVAPDSAAAKAGIQVDDRLAAGDGRRLFGQADLRGVLHRGPQEDGEIVLHWLRDENGATKVHAGVLEVEDGWRKTVLWWRTSVSGGAFGGNTHFWPNAANANDRQRAGVGADEMCVRPWVGGGLANQPAAQAGVRNGDLLIAVDGENPNYVGREFVTWFRMKYDKGDIVTVTLVDNNGRRRDVRYQLADWPD